MKELKKLLPAAAFLPVMAVAVCVVWALSGYIPPVFSADAAEEIITDYESTEESRAEETESVTEDYVTAPSIMSVKENAVYRDGTYYGRGKGFAGNITVAVVIEAGKISSISITETNDDDNFIKKASGIISSIIATQSTNVDAVSGATYSSRGIIEAVRDALKQAVVNMESTDELNGNLPDVTKKEGYDDRSSVTEKVSVPKDKAIYNDGTYYGTGEGFAGIIKVKVTVKNKKINSIEILESSDGKEYMESATALLKQIIKKQTTDVDTVSGATYSSTGLIQAVKDALKNAVIKEDSSVSDTTVEKTNTTDETTKNQETTSEGKFPYKDGVYFGTGNGYRGEITAAIIIEEKSIKYVIVTESDDDDTFLSKAKAVISKVMSKQSVNVDVVSGATYSSKGILEAIKNALAEAKRITNGITEESDTTTTQKTTDSTTEDNNETTKQQETSKRKYKDGTYTAEILCNPDDDWDFEPYTISVTVTLKNDVITSISDIKGVGKGYDSYNDWYIKRAAEGTSKYKGVVSSILEKGDLSGIDAVSGATCSSKAIIQAVKAAVEKGKY